MKTATYTLPAFWASALVNGDVSCLKDPEEAEPNRWLASHPELGACLCCSDESEFRWYPYTLDFVFPVTESTP